eukprot:1829365-Pleurochrysis_carterae.AAC.1
MAAARHAASAEVVTGAASEDTSREDDKAPAQAERHDTVKHKHWEQRANLTLSTLHGLASSSYGPLGRAKAVRAS